MIDISLPLERNMITYPGDAPLELYDYRTHEEDGVHITRILMESHTGTHIDAPYHALKDGKTTSSIPLENLMGPCTVVEVEGDVIKADDIPDLSEKRLLFKTRNSGLYGSFDKSFTYLSVEAANKIIDMEIEAVGIDYLSIEKYDSKGMEVHRKLLENGIPIIEGLNLTGVQPGGYGLICLPLRVDLDGAPCRAVLKQ